MNGMTALERAFQLADDGWSLPEIRAVLKREGYEAQQLYGSAVTIQLGKRILAAKGAVDNRGQNGGRPS